MREERFYIGKKIKIIYRLVILITILILTIFTFFFFIKLNYHTTADGILEDHLEIPVKNNEEGYVKNKLVRDNQFIYKDQPLYIFTGSGGESVIKAPLSGKYLEINDEEFTGNKKYDRNQVLGLIIKSGAYFKAMVNERDILSIKLGQNCYVRIWAFDREGYSPLSGEVIFASDIPEYLNKVTYYPVYCQLSQGGISFDSLKIGMSGKSKIEIGKFTLFETLLLNIKRKVNE